MRGRLYTLCARLVDAALLTITALLFLWALCLPIIAVAAPAYTPEEQALICAYERGEVIRLHVLADGDDDDSQRVKLAVRDAIIAAFGDTLKLAGAKNADEALQAINKSLYGIRATALECARQNGFDGSVVAEAGVMLLPEKRYGQVLLPEGEYRALRVTLGSGSGRNWWCILFPQLCLALAGDEVAENDENPDIVWDIGRVLRCWTAAEV